MAELIHIPMPNDWPGQGANIRHAADRKQDVLKQIAKKILVRLALLILIPCYSCMNEK